VICVTRLRLDAAPYEPAPPRRPGTKGRLRTKGQRLPNLADVLAAPTTHWQRVRVPGWYGQGDRLIEFARQPRYGAMPDCRQSAAFCCAILWTGSIRRLSFAPIRRANR
jgi:hypothetical protein